MLEKLREVNITRQKEWPGNENIDAAFRTIEVAGECGELCESMKKYIRAERGIKGSTSDLSDIESEMADVIIAVDLLAKELGIDLSKAVQNKFNKTSEKYNLKTRL